MSVKLCFAFDNQIFLTFIQSSYNLNIRHERNFRYRNTDPSNRFCV